MNTLAFLSSSIGAGEILLVLLVVLLLFGAEKLPAIARSLGRALNEFRQVARDLTRDIMDERPPATPPPPEFDADSSSPYPEERQG